MSHVYPLPFLDEPTPAPVKFPGPLEVSQAQQAATSVLEQMPKNLREVTLVHKPNKEKRKKKGST